VNGLTEEQEQEEPLSHNGERIAKNLREIARHQAAGREQYERFFRKWGWCWDPNDIAIPGLDKETQEAVSKEARESRITHMRPRVWGIIDGRRTENPEWEKWFKSMARGSWALRREWIECIMEVQKSRSGWAVFETWLVNRFIRWHQPKGQKRLMWDEIMNERDPDVLRCITRESNPCATHDCS
jgi:hypothetical protein